VEVDIPCHPREFLEKFASNLQNVAGLFAIGHASWGPGQLEEEIRRGFWLCDKARKNIVFEVPFEDRWNAAIEQMGLDISKISSDIGHA
jgi:Putative transcriptional regulator